MKSKMVRNPDPSKKTIFVKPGEGMYEDWTRQLEWMWMSDIREGSFAIIIVSHRGCFMRHDIKVGGGMLTGDQESKHYDWLCGDHRKVLNSHRDELSHNARLIVVAPKDGSAGVFAKEIAQFLEKQTQVKAELVKYDSATVKAALNDEPKYGIIECNLNGDEHDKPQIYINGELQ